ncbi:MAG: PAS domain S-box protein [Gammaproteobacteria bacterium]|nr:PAS domain S-box protein [Gammaproteobacteria bacterium]
MAGHKALYKRNFLLIAVFSLAVLLLESMTSIFLYQTAFQKQRDQLLALVKSQATLIEAVARFDASFSASDHEKGATGATLSQVNEAHRNYSGFGETGEFLLARLENDNIVFVERTRHKSSQYPDRIPVSEKSGAGATLPMPVEYALSGKSGTVVAYDYRNKEVLAAYTYIPQLGYGLVAKIDMDEVRRPYIRMTLYGFGIALLVIAIASALLFRINKPMIKRIIDNENYNRMLFDSSPSGLALFNEQDRLIDANTAIFGILGYDASDQLQLNHGDLFPSGSPVLDSSVFASKSGYEKALYRKDGTKVFVRVSARYIEVNGRKLLLASMEDISQRRLAEQQAHESGEILRTILDSTGEGIYGVDMNGICIFANNSCATLLGYPDANSIIGKNMHSLVHSAVNKDREDMQDECIICKASRSDEESLSVNGIFRRRSGESFHAECWSQPMFQDGKIIGTVITFNDITERNIVERALRNSEARLNEAQRLAKVGAWELDLTNNRLEWSDEIFRIFEVDKARFDASYEAFLNTIHPDDRDMVNQAYTDSLANKAPYEITHRLKMSDGRIKHVRETCESFFDVDGKPVRSVGTVQDITEQVRAEKQIENMFRLSYDMVGLGNMNGRLTKINPSFRRTFGYDDKEILERRFISFIHPDDVASVKEVTQNLRKGKLQHLITNRCICKNGEYRWIEWNIHTSLQDNLFYLTGRDITDRKKTEQELDKYRHHLEDLVDERTNELKLVHEELVKNERLATLGRLTATVSHELRNPLGAIKPSIYVIRKKCAHGDERLLQAIDRVDRNISRCDHIIDELLDFTRHMTLSLQPVALDNWLGYIIDEMQIPESIPVNTQYDLDGYLADIDQNRLQRAVINVVENACQAIQEMSEIIGLGYVPKLGIATALRNDRIEITVTDNGNGIPATNMERIFEPLFSTKGFGVGLGMPTVKQIMTQHKGDIVIHSAEGKGTTVVLWLPVRQGHTVAA